MIHTLSPDLVNLIAAGEIIDSFLAVVRELVENALDAQATHIHIYIDWDNWQIQVRDNGQGMTWDDLNRCALPHSTSKIQSLDDFFAVQSLGFRGQALHSLCQVSQLTIASCVENQGYQVSYDSQGQIQQSEPKAIAQGTLVTVKALFANLEQRRKALPSKTQQGKAIQTYLQTLALCYPQITWQAWQNDKPWLNFSPAKTPLQIFPQILKTAKPSDFQDYHQALQPPIIPTETAHLSLYLGLPDRLSRHRPDWVKIAINHRPVHCPELEQTLIQACYRTLPRDRFPVAFLHLTVSPHHIDWNRHPAKTDIYLQALDFWQDSIRQAVTHCLQFTEETQPQQRVTQLLKTAEKSLPYQVNSLEQSLENQILGSRPLQPLKAIGQVNQTYIVAEHETGCWLIEQHVAQERVLYEQLQEHWRCVSLEKPLLLSHLQPQQVEQLQRLGLEIEPFGEEIWAVRSLPEPLLHREDQREALLELSIGGDLSTAQAAIACRTAIKNGTELTLTAMQTLLDQWQQTRNPRTCPHGRPIYLALEETALARFFRRQWLIGK
ncbi:MAG: DNA mismatch repair endonuclease MutL [Merismopediaceae bacterium]|nr:DNA mismatch repair endonuclease MutL [Merismopediaceae bacterium]